MDRTRERHLCVFFSWLLLFEHVDEANTTQIVHSKTKERRRDWCAQTTNQLGRNTEDGLSVIALIGASKRR